jgi:nicotinate-nucleotide adenylyltransferase
MSRVGILGGTFDPIHMGHLVLAEQVRDRAGLDIVLFVPAARSPHKRDEPRANADERLRMVHAAIADQPAFALSAMEIVRGGPSYTFDTVTEMMATNVDDEFTFIIGADGLPDLPDWHRARDLVRLVPVITATRPGYPFAALDELVDALGAEVVKGLRERLVEIPLIGISSTEIRARVRAEQTIRYLVPRGVESIIAARGLYR